MGVWGGPGSKEEGQWKRTLPPPPASTEDQLQPPEREQGEAWFEAVTDLAFLGNTQSEQAKAVLSFCRKQSQEEMHCIRQDYYMINVDL